MAIAKWCGLVFFDAGGGHRSAANSLRSVIQREGYPWDLRDVNLQEVLDPIDIIRKMTGVRIQSTRTFFSCGTNRASP